MPRNYGNMKNMEIICPYCGNNSHVKKSGFYRVMQRYKCGKCSRTFTTADSDKRIRYPILLKKLALSLYLCGVTIRGIEKALGRIFGVKLSFNLIESWLANSSSMVEEERERRKKESPARVRAVVPVLEVEELQSHARKKLEIQRQKNPGLLEECGLLWIGGEVGLLYLED
ncbi:MAG: hypothetical protein LBU15_00465 [Rickettsiales bacterium]|nr:hypothetical protein [Rickettsiales bacterium]